MKIAVIYHSETGNTLKMAELVKEGCDRAGGVESRLMSVDALDTGFISEACAVILGCPTYEGSCSWQMKKLLDTIGVSLAGKLGGVFASLVRRAASLVRRAASQNWPGGGGADFAEMTMIAGMLVRGMLIYSGGITRGAPYLHFGAVSQKAPAGLYAERCLKLGENIATKAKELFPA